MGELICRVCKCELEPNEAYEYRGAIGCAEHFDEVREARDFERAEVMAEESAKLAPLTGLDFGDNAIGRANRKILKPALEIASKEGGRLKSYERPND